MDIRNIAGNDNNELVTLTQYYGDTLPDLMSISLRKVPDPILRDIAVMIHGTLTFDNEWRVFAYNFGIRDNMLLQKINEGAKRTQEMPVYIVLTGVAQHDKSFGNLVQTLLHLQRFDILEHIKSSVETILKGKSAVEERSVECEVKRLISHESKSCCSSTDSDISTATLQSESSLSIKSNNWGQRDNLYFHGTPIVENRKYECNSFQRTPENFYCSDQVMDYSVQHPILQTSKKRLRLSSDPQPSAPAEELLSVCILNTEQDTSLAEQLSTILAENGIKAKMLSDFKHLLMVDPHGALQAVLKEVDFIVPVVSESFLQQVHPHDYSKYIESPDAMDNRGFYQLILSEYRYNQYLNFRVKSVLVPELDRSLLKYELILSSALRLWAEVPKLFKILRETKKFFPKYPIH